MDINANYYQTTFLDFLVIPDIHCRTFWKDAVKNFLLPVDTPHCTTNIVFLGDYVDGYPNEWDNEKYIIDGIDQLEEIINLKKEHPHQIKLLLGNHDCGYAISQNICPYRYDWVNAARISKLFKDNKKCFQLFYENKGILFSHAGVHKGFLEDSSIDSKQFINLFNDAWLTDNRDILMTLRSHDSHRGFSLDRYGSPVWADIHSFFDFKGDPIDEGFGFQVFGHTQRDKPIITDKFACLDCKKTFLIDEYRNFLDPSTMEKIN